MVHEKSLNIHTTPIPGLLMVELPVHGDNRGWFKENWQNEKMTAKGLPNFRPVQNNVSFNGAVGTTRGIHAEPWDKYVSTAAGRVFGAWVDLREGPNFGTVFTAELDASRAVFVPRGVGNAFQTLEPNTSYIYLVNDHYSPDAEYTSINLNDGTLAIKWPIPLAQAELSAKDRAHPSISSVSPIARQKTLIIGAGGQVGRALRKSFPIAEHVDFCERTDLDLAGPHVESALQWRSYDTIINAAAFTAVDNAETPEGRLAAWATNVSGVAALARVATVNNITLVHISSDYVFDGTSDRPYREDDPMCPLGVYGQTKAAADQLVANTPRHYIVRTSWVIGHGRNFVTTMLALAGNRVDPSVVRDQCGRLTFASEIARVIRHLIDTRAPYGTYNVTGDGAASSWHAIAEAVFRLGGHDPSRVKGVSTAEYFAGATHQVAPRPQNSVLDLTKIKATGFTPEQWDYSLTKYIESELGD